MASKHDQVLREKAAVSLRSTTDRIHRVFSLATPVQIENGKHWYRHGNEIVRDLADKANISPERAAVVIAHLSPQTSWKRNVRGAIGLLLEGHAPHCIEANVSRAKVAIAAPDPWMTFGFRALKTERFARNLLLNDEPVTVDVWALRVAFGVGWGDRWRTGDDGHLAEVIKRVGVYEAVERAYQLAANRVGLSPAATQAVCWIVARSGRVN